MWIFQALTTRLDRQHDTLLRIEALLRRFVSPPRPGSLLVTLLREDSDMLVYQANLPALPDPIGDIVGQRFSVTANDITVLEVDLAVTDTVSPEFSVNDGDNVKLSLRYVDDATPPNLSEASTQEFVARDTIAPSAPGAFGEVTLVREV